MIVASGVERGIYAGAIAGTAPLAFADFFAEQYPSLVTVARAVARDPGHAEDIAQEALLRAYRDWDRVRTLDKPGAWARRVVVNLACSRLRRLGSEHRALARLGARRDPPAEPPTVDPVLWAAVRALAPRQRAAVALHYLDDLPVADIAEILGCSVSAATSHLHAARRNLARRLEPDLTAEVTR